MHQSFNKTEIVFLKSLNKDWKKENRLYNVKINYEDNYLQSQDRPE